MLMKRVENVNMLRKKEKAGFNQATTELQKEIEKLQKSLKKATQPQKENNLSLIHISEPTRPY